MYIFLKSGYNDCVKYTVPYVFSFPRNGNSVH